jgi:hypothetical protein
VKTWERLLMRMSTAKSSGCAASVSSVVCSSSTAPPERSTSTSTTSCTTCPRVTPSSTSVLSSSTYVHHDIMTTVNPAQNRPLTLYPDPQGQGREGSRQGHQGGDGRQAREDQGREGEEAGACAAEACCAVGRGVNGRHDKHLAWVFSRLKEGVNLLSISAYAVMFHVRLGHCNEHLSQAYSRLTRLPLLNVSMLRMSIKGLWDASA